MKNIVETVNEVVRQNVTGAEAGSSIPADQPFADIGLSSFGLMRSLLQIEKELGLRVVTPKAVRNLRTVGDLHALFGA
jgi:acyl carrier protein